MIRREWVDGADVVAAARAETEHSATEPGVCERLATPAARALRGIMLSTSCQYSRRRDGDRGGRARLTMRAREARALASAERFT